MHVLLDQLWLYGARLFRQTKLFSKLEVLSLFTENLLFFMWSFRCGLTYKIMQVTQLFLEHKKNLKAPSFLFMNIYPVFYGIIKLSWYMEVKFLKLLKHSFLLWQESYFQFECWRCVCHAEPCLYNTGAGLQRGAVLTAPRRFPLWLWPDTSVQPRPVQHTDREAAEFWCGERESQGHLSGEWP